DAEDVLHDAYLRWSAVDLAGVNDTKAYLAKVVTRQALNYARAAARRREDYVGPWLPEPIRIDERDVSDDLILAESVSTAMLVVLNTLTPDERVVFVLREVFDFALAEIADIVEKSEPAVRQIAYRARKHVHARRSRVHSADVTRAAEVTAAFFAAVTSGRVDELMALLAPDVVYTADSDGKASAARRPVQGVEAVATLLRGLMRLGQRSPDLRIDTHIFNGSPGVAVHFEGVTQAVFMLRVVDDVVADIYVTRNPDKLRGVSSIRSVTR
ncbi:MAG: sigma-70 family RNA polymerase sigma factor, partial [Gordonia sp. (in: high G+C Gram-positive bacteria)]